LDNYQLPHHGLLSKKHFIFGREALLMIKEGKQESKRQSETLLTNPSPDLPILQFCTMSNHSYEE